MLRIESGHGFYYPDASRIRAEPLALGQFIAAVIDWISTPGDAKRESCRCAPTRRARSRRSIRSRRRKRATAPGPGYPPDAPEVDAAYVVVDAHLVYPPVADAAALRFEQHARQSGTGSARRAEYPSRSRRRPQRGVSGERPAAGAGDGQSVSMGSRHDLHSRRDRAHHRAVPTICCSFCAWRWARPTLAVLAWRVTGSRRGIA